MENVVKYILHRDCRSYSSVSTPGWQMHNEVQPVGYVRIHSPWLHPLTPTSASHVFVRAASHDCWQPTENRHNEDPHISAAGPRSSRS